MGEQFLDHLARGLANRTISRRQALKLAAASALGAAGVLGSATVAEAAPMCPRRGAGCCKRCRHTQKTCSCIRTTGGKRHCVHQCCPTSGTTVCNSTSDCASGQVCMKTVGTNPATCCGTFVGFSGVCMFSCTQPVPQNCNPFTCL